MKNNETAPTNINSNGTTCNGTKIKNKNYSKNLKLVSIVKSEKGKQVTHLRFLTHNGPTFSIEPAGSDSFFLKRDKDNKLVGLVQDGQINESDEYIEKLHHLSKLNLVPLTERDKKRQIFVNGIRNPESK